MQTSDLAAALLSVPGIPAHTLDLLYRTANGCSWPALAAAPSAELALPLIVDGPADRAQALVAVLTDPDTLAAIAVKDKRKTVRAAVAANPATPAATLLTLLRWGLRTSPETSTAAIGRTELDAATIVAELAAAVPAAVLSAGVSSRPNGVEPHLVIRRVLDAGDPALLTALFALEWPALHALLLSRLLTETDIGFGIRQALHALPEQYRATQVKSLLERGGRYNSELTEVMLETFPDHLFPWSLFVRFTGEPVNRWCFDESATERLAGLAREGDRRALVLLAGADDVSDTLRFELLGTGHWYLVQLIASHSEVSGELLDAVFDLTQNWPLKITDGPRQQLRNPKGKNDDVRHPLMWVARRSGKTMTDVQVLRLVRWLLDAGVASGLFDQVWAAFAARVPSDVRIELIRWAGQRAVAAKWLTGKLTPVPSAEEAAELIAKPENSFRYEVRHSNGYGTGQWRTPQTADEIVTALADTGVDVVRQVRTCPWLSTLLNRVSNPLGRFGAPIVAYLWDRLGAFGTHPGVVETMLEMAPEWDDTLENLVATMTALYSDDLDASLATR